MDVLIYGDTESSAALRHELPLSIGDPFLYIEADGRRAVVTHALEEERIAAAAPGVERLLEGALGLDELLAAGRSRNDAELEICVRAAQSMGVREALVPPGFPLALADRLRAAGVALTPDDRPFADRRRRKTDTELAGIRRAADVAMRAMGDAAAMLREARIDGGSLRLGAEPLTAEDVRARIRELCARAGAPAPPDIIVKPMGPHASIGHDPGAGPLPAHTPIEIDLWPRDERSGCWADMTRTFVRGDVSGPIAELHELALESYRRSRASIRPGVPASEVYDVACEVFEAAGHPTQRTKLPGETLREGFYFSLGHGVGLEVHEAPLLGRGDVSPLVAGDVLAVEPGTVVAGVGGARVEDLLLVTDGGSEALTDACPYELTP